MVEKNNTTLTIAIIALLTSLGLGGSSLLDNPSALDNYYICDINYATGEFARISSTEYSAYPNEFDNKGYQRCNENGIKGKWKQITAFAEANNIDINTLIPSDNDNEEIIDSPIVGAVKYQCNQHECIKIGD